MTTKSDKDVRHVVAKKRPHKLSIDVKVIKNIGGPSCWIITIIFSITFQNNQMNYVNFLSHDNLNMIKRYYLNLVSFVLDKLLKFYHIVFLFVFTPNQNLWFFGWNFLIILKKMFEKDLLKNPQIYEVIPIELFVDMKNF